MTDLLALQSEALDRALLAITTSPALRDGLIFKGARVLNLHLDDQRRQSNDIDANVTKGLFDAMRDLDTLAALLKEQLRRCLARELPKDDPVRYALQGVTVRRRPLLAHARGWDSFQVKLALTDALHPELELPPLEVDISVPEALGPTAVVSLPLGVGHIQACSLSRITGEKLRAFLSSLPAYRQKVYRQRTRVRCKDLYDVARVVAVRPLAENPVFWAEVGVEFRLGCAARFIDCEGLSTFAEGLERTERFYDRAEEVPDDIPFEQAWAAVRQVVARLEADGVTPLRFELPALVG